MTIINNKVEEFLTLTASLKSRIKAFDGCRHLDILRDVKHRDIIFSYSHWESEEHLNAYRDSEFFKGTWSTIRQWFGAAPEAWSTEML